MAQQHVHRTTPRKRHPKEYFIWCDESIQQGLYCSNFYGGVLVESCHLEEVSQKLFKVCRNLNFKDEIKWQKVSMGYLEKYMAVMDAFFELIKEGKVKVRIMYRQTAYVARNLSATQQRDEYFILYYHFIHHAFGLQYADYGEAEVYLRLYFDKLPDTLEKRQRFKEFIRGLQSKREFQLARIKIRKQDITEVDSKKHLILQLLDVVLGAMSFRLNMGHKQLVPGTRRRGNRTKAKEKLYKHILSHVYSFYPRFNIGASTGTTVRTDRWQHPYRHWNFRPKDFETDEGSFK